MPLEICILISGTTTVPYSQALDPDLFGTAKEREKARAEAEANLDQALANACDNDAGARMQLQECADALRLAESALASAQSAASAVFGEFAGRDISMEEQTDILLFSSVVDVTRFLSAHPELSK